MLQELGLDSLDLSPKIDHNANFSEAMEARRLDAEYWGHQYTKLVDHLREIPHNSLAQLASFSNGATPRGAEYLDTGIPFLRIQNVGKNKLNLDDVVYIDEMTHNKLLRRSQLEPGDVLVTITGRIGTSAVVPKDMAIGNINQHIVRLRLKSSDIRPYYISTFLNSTFGILQTEREAYGTTRDALPYYCLERVIVPKASEDLQFKVEQKILEAERSLSEAKILLEKAKYKVEKIILSEGSGE
jgi:restriction endonuclease S subunit